MASIFVGDLASEVTEAELHEKFSQVGAILSVKVCRDKETGKSLGYGYVLYAAADDAEKAVEKLNFDLMHNQNMQVVMADKAHLSHLVQGNVFVKNLDRSVDSNLLYRSFSSFGNILSCKVPHGKKGSKCHGFVQFETEETANSAINSMNGAIFYGKKLYVGHFLNKEQREPAMEMTPASGVASTSLRTVYVKNLSPTVDSVFLKITCSPYGDVSNVKIIRDTDGSSKGFAFVTFKKVEEAAKAIEMLNGKDVDGRILFAGPAMKKAGRKHQQLQQQQPAASQEQQQTAQHDLKEITIEESIIVEQQTSRKQIPPPPQQQQQPKHQQQQATSQQLPNGQSKSVQLFPAMPSSKRQQQPTSQQHQQHLSGTVSQTSPLAVQFPCIVNIPTPVPESCRILQLPQIHHHHQHIYQPQQHVLEPQPDQHLHFHLPPQQQQQLQIENHTQHHHQDDIPVQSEQHQQQQQLNQAQLINPPSQQQQQQQQVSNQAQAATTASSTPQGVNLYVKHLDDDVDDTILKGMFSKFGEVISAKVMMEGEKSRGFGFVCFARAEDAARATRDMRRRVDDMNKKPLYVAPAQRKEERQAFFREKLKSRQSDIHHCDVETAQKLIKSLDSTRESERVEVSEVNQIILNLPAGDSSNPSSKAEVPVNDSSTFTNASSLHPSLNQSDCRNWDNLSCRYQKFFNAHRPLPKRYNLFNFESFYVDNLRTPLIEPTRLCNPVEEQMSLFPVCPAHTDTNCWCPYFVEDDKYQSCAIPHLPYTINTSCATKTPETSKRLNDLSSPLGRINPGSPWKSDDYQEAGSKNCPDSLRAPEIVAKPLSPIGCKPHFSNNETDTRILNARNSQEKPRPNHNYSLRPRPTSRTTPSSSDSNGDCSPSMLSKNSKLLSENGCLFVSSQSQDVSDCFKRDLSTLETIFDPLNELLFSRSTVPEIVAPRTLPSQGAAVYSKCSAFSDSESYSTDSETLVFSMGLRRGFASHESLISLDPLRSMRTRTASLSLEFGQRRSPNLKRRSDSFFDADSDDLHASMLNSHWRPKRRMMALPPQHPGASETCTEPRTPSPSLAIPGEGELSLRTMSNWPTDQQKLVLAVPMTAQISEVLQSMMVETLHDSRCWNEEMGLLVESLVSKSWTLDSLTERLMSMILEMDVPDMINLLQSRDCLVYLISEGLKQLESLKNKEPLMLPPKTGPMASDIEEPMHEPELQIPESIHTDLNF